MTFSIVVVVSRGVENKDRREVFLKCFEALCGQDFPKQDFEVVVVDSGSGFEEEAIKALEKIASIRQVSFSYINPSLGNIGPAKARNVGINLVSQGKTKIKSEIIAFTDDDTLVPRDWLNKLSEGFKKYPDAAGVGGLTLPQTELGDKNIFAHYDQFIYTRYPKASGKSTNINEHPVFSGNIAYKLVTLEKVGGFDESFEPWIYGEDADLKDRVVKASGFLVFSPVVNMHLAKYTWNRFIRQQESRGAGILKFRQKHNLEQQGRAGILLRLLVVPAAAVYYLAKNRDAKIALLETAAYFFRQVGKLKYYEKIKAARKTKILFADHTPLVGGAQLALLRHLKYLNKDIFTPIAVVSKQCQDFNHKLGEISGLSRYFINFPKLKTFNPFAIFSHKLACLRLYLITIKEEPDVLVANTERSFYVCFPVALFCRKKLLLIIRDFEYSKKLLSLTSFKVCCYICVSKKIWDFYVLPEEKSTIIYVGSDIQKYLSKVSNEVIMNNRRELGAAENGLVIGFVGRLLEWKGPKLLLEAFAQILKTHQSLNLVFVGDGPDRENLEKLSRLLGVEKKVHFAGFSQDVASWYRTLDIFVHASIEDEPFATTVVEAAFAKLPIVATDTGGTWEFVDDGVNGLLIKPEKESMVLVLKTLIESEDLRRRLGEAAYEKASWGFTEEKITKEFEQVYKNV